MGMPFLQGKAEFGELFPTPAKWCTAPKKTASAGDVLVSIRAPVGPTNLSTADCCIGRGLAALHPLDDISDRYILYAIRNSEAELAAKGSGSTFSAIGGAELRRHRIQLAPLPEQRRIVDAIEAHLAKVAAAEKSIEQALRRLVAYRAAVLRAACEGRLVPTEAELARAEGRSFESAPVLIARAKRKKETFAKKRRQRARSDDSYSQWKPPLPNGWAWARWEEIGESQDGRPFPSSDYTEGGIKLLRPGNLSQDGRVVWNEKHTRYLPEKYVQEREDLLVGPGELVMNLTAQSLEDEFLGRTCLTGDDTHALLNQRLARLTPYEIDTRYLLCVFRSRIFRSFVEKLNTGSLIQHIFTSQVAKFEIPVPPLVEQLRIVAEVERRLSAVERLEAAIEQNLHRAKRLRQAILKRAFEGRLVPQDPRDEPASALLARIRKEREAMGAMPRRRAKSARERRQSS